MLCQCGCGQPAPIAKRTYGLQGAVKGQPQRYVAGHNPKSHPAPIDDPAKVYELRIKPYLQPNGECLEHGRFIHPENGYGYAQIGRKWMRAHRIAYAAFNGSIPEGLCVMHTCDNPPCCNPAHLKVGTQKENVADMIRKGRGKSQKTA